MIFASNGSAGYGDGNNVQGSFTAAGAAQCGYRAPSLVIAATALLRKSLKSQDAQILEARSCVCAGADRTRAYYVPYPDFRFGSILLKNVVELAAWT